MNTDCCTTITIPLGTEVRINSTVAIGSNHNNLQLNIFGTLKWVGGTSSGARVISVTNASGVTISGNSTGLITSCYSACREEVAACGMSAPDCKNEIAHAVRLENASNFTLEDIAVTELSSIIVTEEAASSGVTVNNVHGQYLTYYGIFMGVNQSLVKEYGLTVTNCTVSCVNGEYGMRLYAHQMAVSDCEVLDTEDFALWTAEGDGIEITNFESANEGLRIGPNNACNDGSGPDVGQRARWVRVNNVIDAVDVVVEPGTLGCYLTAIASQNGVTVGRGGTPSGTNVPRPYDRIYWDEFTHTTTGVDVVPMTGCNGPFIGPCVADISGTNGLPDGAVDIDDLLAVIASWGTCNALGACCISSVCHLNFTAADCAAQSGTFFPDTDSSYAVDTSFEACRVALCQTSTPACTVACRLPPNSCLGDIVPEEHGDRSVDIDDLLMVISNWGCLVTNPSANDEAPKTVSECEQKCNDQFPGYGQDFADCVEGCVESLVHQGLLD